jgi:phosphate ABC transporter phosphate-binding protein
MNSKYLIVIAVVAIIIIVGSIAAYTILSKPSSPSSQSVTLNGAGATFPYPLLNAIITKYSTAAKPNVQINYQSIGSGGGISAYKQPTPTVDFAASDAPLSVTDSANIPNALHIPETIGAVTVTYNLPGIGSGLHLTGQVIADIFQGKITMWNDPAIQSLNPDTHLPAQGISPVYRSDGSGTTYIFTSYLSGSSTSWSSAIGSAKSVSWPVGRGANGNTGVASTVNGTQYTIGYVELAYILQNGMTAASIKNPAGNWIQPSLDSTTIAVQSGASGGLPTGNGSWTNVSLLNTQDPNAYPIVSFTYLLVYKELNVVPGMTQNKATSLAQFLWYVVHDGQDLAPGLSYAKLPSNVVQIDETTIKSITYNGQTLQVS